ncbi:MAG: hypothetical protein AAB074_19255 [Planctomycetota bacterium]
MRFLAALLLVFVGMSRAGAGELEEQLAQIVKQLDSENPGEREAAQVALDTWCEDAGERASRLVEAAARTAPPEAAARLRTKLEWLRLPAEVLAAREILDELGLPDVGKASFVVFNAGPREGRDWIRFRYETGWLLRSDESSISLETEDGLLELPRVPTHLREWQLENANRKPVRPGPGDWENADFESTCQTILEDREELIGGGSVSQVARCAVLARWASQRGHGKLALQLARLCVDIVGAMKNTPGTIWTSTSAIATGVSRKIEERLLTSASSGMDRRELLAGWSRLANLKENRSADLARGVALGYAKLVREDEPFAKLPAAELLRLPRGRQVEYWVHELRELTVKEAGSYSCIEEHLKGAATAPMDPASNLVALGDDAIPVLLAHLLDTEPTRIVCWAPRAYADRGEQDNWKLDYLVSIGDACGQILAHLTGERLMSDGLPYVTGRWNGRRSLDFASRWWNCAKDLSQEERLLGQLNSNPEFAASGLLALDPGKHHRRVLDWILSHAESSTSVLRVFRHRCDPRDSERLEELLNVKSESVLLETADILWWKCGSEAGLRRLAERLAAGEPSFSAIHVQGAADLLVRIPADSAATAFGLLLKSGNPRTRRELVEVAATAGSRSLAEVLVSSLDDKEKTGDTCEDANGRCFLSVCDFAARSLQKLLKRAGAHGLPALGERPDDTEIENLKAWWRKYTDSLDWPIPETKNDEEKK